MRGCDCSRAIHAGRKPGDFFKTNKKYEGEYVGVLKLISIDDHCFINGDSTYLMEKEDGTRANFGRSWVDPIGKNKILREAANKVKDIMGEE